MDIERWESKQIANVLRGLSARLGAPVSASDRDDAGLDRISSVIADGNKGVARIPGKHGGARSVLCRGDRAYPRRAWNAR